MICNCSARFLYIHLPVSPSCVFDVNVKESPFDAVLFCLWMKAVETTSREDYSSDRTLLAFCKAL